MSRGTVTRPVHDRLLDTIKSIAILRVIAWHTWSWPWLSWIPAMPTMFFANGALLHSSLERRGWAATVRERARRLLIPFWFYGIVCWIAMLADGWSPTWADAFAWILPLVDPVGSDSLPGLWIPLWYLRAYVWFVLISGVLHRIERHLGSWTIAGASILTAFMWAMAERGHELPFALADMIGYMPFVLAGMVYRARGSLGRPPLLVATGLLSVVGALGAWRRFGPIDGVVNRSYLLMLLVGLAGVLLAVGFRERILGMVDASTRTGNLIGSINSRALTVYLWQGFGLVAADRLVGARIDQPVFVALGSIIVVAGIVVASTSLFGPIEDVAARRVSWREVRGVMWRRMRGRQGLVRSSGTLVAVVGVVVSLVVVPADHDPLDAMPLSGRAVVARAGMIGDEIDRGPRSPVDTGTTAEDIFADWLDENAGDVEELDLRHLHIVLMDADGNIEEIRWGDVPGEDDPLLWWSMTKSVTAAWMMQLTEEGIVDPSDLLEKWVPEAPHAQLITLEHLARHVSGIAGNLDSGLFDADPTVDLDAYYSAGELTAAPGERFDYSRIGYLLLGLALERASGVPWMDAVTTMAEHAGVRLRFDEDLYPKDAVTDPDGHGYRGALWASGGIVSDPVDLVGLFHWLFTEGLSTASIDTMTRFSADPDRWYYGLGLMPVCPCDEDDGFLRSSRFGLDSAMGTYAVNRDGAVVLLRPDDWFIDDMPVASFFELERRLLDHLEENGVS